VPRSRASQPEKRTLFCWYLGTHSQCHEAKKNSQYRCGAVIPTSGWYTRQPHDHGPETTYQAQQRWRWEEGSEQQGKKQGDQRSVVPQAKLFIRAWCSLPTHCPRLNQESAGQEYHLLIILLYLKRQSTSFIEVASFSASNDSIVWLRVLSHRCSIIIFQRTGLALAQGSLLRPLCRFSDGLAQHEPLEVAPLLPEGMRFTTPTNKDKIRDS